jgi:O-antigen ligase
MAAEKPITGIGFYAFQRSYSSYDLSGGSFGTEKASHSAWFGVLAETGYPGLILYLLIVLSALYALSSIRRRTKGLPEMQHARTYAAGMQMSLVAYIVGATFLSFQYNEMFWHLIGLTVALDRITAAPSSQALTSTAVPAVAIPIRNGRVVAGS